MQKVVTVFLVILFILSCNTFAADKLFTFQQAFNTAVENNPDLQVQITKAHAMKGAFIQSGLYPNPQILLEAENIGGSGRYSGYESAETTLSMTQAIPLGNQLQYARQATLADYKASLASIRVQKATLYIAVGSLYVDSLYAEQWYQVTKKLVSLNEQIVKEIKRRTQAGIGKQLDLKLAQIRLGEAQIQQKLALRDVRIAHAKLGRLLGGNLPEKAHLTDKGLSHQQWHWADILQRLKHSPLLQEKMLQLNAKRRTITAVKKDVWPSLNIQLGGRHFSDDGSNAAIVSTGTTMPVFDRNQGKIVTAEAQYSQTTHELHALRLELLQNLSVFYLQAQQSHYEAQRVTQSLLPLSRDAVALAQQGYQQGLYTYIELSNAMNTLYEEEKHYQQAHAENHKARMQINGLLGEFFTDKQ